MEKELTRSGAGDSGSTESIGGPRGRRREALRRVGTRLGTWPRALALGLLCTLVGCKVPAPSVRQGLDYGFRTPEQTFRSWRTAVQGDLLVEEYKTLSKGWKARNGGVSLFTYSEARDVVLEAIPQLRWLLYRAKEPEVLARGEQVVILQSRIPGPLWFSDSWLVVRLVREGFWDLWVDQSPLQPIDGRVVQDLVGSHNLHYNPKDSPLLYALIDFDRAQWQFPGSEDVRLPDDIGLLQVGWEWKIDAFDVLDAPLDPNQPVPNF